MNEADIQVLATIRRTEIDGRSSDKVTIESHTDKYWTYCEDWSDSWQRLVDAGFITGDDRVLDLGCGAGGISEYISDETGAHVTGLDYAASAIDVAMDRTQNNRDRLTFVQGDMNALDFPDHSFDKIISLDTIYWVADIDEALASIVRLLKPGGKLGIFIAITPQMGDSPGAYEPHGNWVAKALQKQDLSFDTHDYTESFLLFWPKMKEVVMELHDDFVAEGNEVIFGSFMLDADEDYLPAAEAGKLRRYLYVVDAPRSNHRHANFQ